MLVQEAPGMMGESFLTLMPQALWTRINLVVIGGFLRAPQLFSLLSSYEHSVPLTMKHSPEFCCCLIPSGTTKPFLRLHLPLKDDGSPQNLPVSIMVAQLILEAVVEDMRSCLLHHWGLSNLLPAERSQPAVIIQ